MENRMTIYDVVPANAPLCDCCRNEYALYVNSLFGVHLCYNCINKDYIEIIEKRKLTEEALT